MLEYSNNLLKFIYSEEATKFCKIFTLRLPYIVSVKSKLKISQNFVAFSEYMNFNNVFVGCKNENIIWIWQPTNEPWENGTELKHFCLTIAQALISPIECKYSSNQGTVKSEFIHGQKQKGRVFKMTKTNRFCIRPKFKRCLFILFLWRYSRTYCRHSNRHVLGTFNKTKNTFSLTFRRLMATGTVHELFGWIFFFHQKCQKGGCFWKKI